MMKYCISCRSRIPEDALECPACGKIIATPPPPPALDNSGLKSAGIAIGVVVLLFVAGILVFSRKNAVQSAPQPPSVAAAPQPQQTPAQGQAQAGLTTPDVILKEQKMRDDKRGATYTFYCTRVNSIHCRVHYDGASQFAFDGVIYDGDKYDLDKVLKYQPIRVDGVTACAFYTSKGVYLATSADDGNNFELPALISNELTLHKATLMVGGSSAAVRVEGRATVADQFYGISAGDKVYAESVYSEKRQKWERTGKGHAFFSDN